MYPHRLSMRIYTLSMSASNIFSKSIFRFRNSMYLRKPAAYRKGGDVRRRIQESEGGIRIHNACRRVHGYRRTKEKND